MTPKRRQSDPVLDRLEKEVFGNGKDGLLTTSTRLEGKVDNIACDIKEIKDFILACEKRIREVELEQANSKGKASQTAMIIGWIIGGIGLVFTAIKTFAKG